MAAGSVSRRSGAASRYACAICAAVGVLVAILFMLEAPAQAAAPERQAWWNRFHGPLPAPAPPDVPADGLYVSYSADVDAIAAVVFTLAPGVSAQKLVLELAPTTTPLPQVQACRVVPEAAAFGAVQNGRWSELPRYDCTDAVAAIVDANRTTMTFDAPAPVSDGVLAVALVPKGPGRAAFRRPGDRALEVAEVPPAEPTRDAATPVASPAQRSQAVNRRRAVARAGADSRRDTAVEASPQPSVEPEPSIVAAPTATPEDEPPLARGRRAAPGSTEDGDGIWDLRKRLGGVAGVVLLTAVLLYYSQGRGPLGARLDAASLLSRQEQG